MIKQLRITNMGPHEDRVLNFPAGGFTTISGPSECGKSLTMAAVAFALWGKDENHNPFSVERIRKGCKFCEVALTTTSGTVFTRKMNVKRKHTRMVTDASGPVGYPTDKKFAERLAVLGVEIDLLHLVMFPMSWMEDIQGEGGGRPLRDKLLRILPPVDIRDEIGEVMAESGHELNESDPLDESTAKVKRHDQFVSVEQLKGRLQGMRELLAKLTADADAPLPSYDASAAEAYTEAAEAWRAYDEAYRAWENAESHEADYKISMHNWRADIDELGDEPPVPDANDAAAGRDAYNGTTTALRIARQRLDAAEADVIAKANMTREGDPLVVTARMALDGATSDLEKIEVKLTDARAAGDTCPTCGRDGWEAAADTVTDLIAQRDVIVDGKELAAKALINARRSATSSINRAIDEAKTEKSGARMAKEDAVKAHDAAAIELNRLDGMLTAHANWKDRRVRIGNEPTPVDMSAVAPVRPSFDRPQAEKLLALRADRDAYTAAVSKAAHRTKDLTDLEKSVLDATQWLADAEAEWKRRDALVDAVRIAPGRAASKQLAVMGDMGPVCVEFRDKPAVAISVGGFPWDVLSTGKQVVGDAWFRAGIRRAFGAKNGWSAPWLPIFIDRTQDVKGQPLPAIDSPVVLLHTTDTPTLTVRATNG
jgi:hypothetical protein